MNLLDSKKGRIVLFTALYASEGGPIGFIWWALPTLLRERGAPIEQITGLMAVLVLFWTFKFLWAPLVDSLRTPRWGYRHWIIAAQLCMGFTLLPLMWVRPDTHFGWFAGLLMLHALCATIQDVSIDALAIRTVPESQRGTVNGCMQAGMLTGRSLFGGGALLMAAYFEWHWIFAGLIALVWSSLVLVWMVHDPTEARALPGVSRSVQQHAREFVRTLRTAVQHKRTWFGLAFALTSAAAFEATGALAGPFLLDHGVSKETIGWFFGLPVVGLMIVGGLIGGPLSDQLGRRRALAIYLTGFVAAVVALGFTIDARLAMWFLAVMYWFIGLFVAASYALFMDLTDPKLGATQFSAFMAATNGCESWATLAGGKLMTGFGSSACFLTMSVVSLLSLPLLMGMKPADKKG